MSEITRLRSTANLNCSAHLTQTFAETARDTILKNFFLRRFPHATCFGFYTCALLRTLLLLSILMTQQEQ